MDKVQKTLLQIIQVWHILPAKRLIKAQECLGKHIFSNCLNIWNIQIYSDGDFYSTVPENWRKLQSERRHNLHYSPDIIKMIK
jgi:hypothetical protein